MSQIDKLEGQVKEFAIACYDGNSVEELKSALSVNADENDCAEWNISAAQWKVAVEAALAEMLADAA